MSFGEIVTWPFAKLMVWFYNLTGNYGLALIFFALAVNLIMTPFMAKSKKSMMRSSRLQPKIQELQKRHEGNQQKLNAEMQKLYQEEGINPMSGCLWSLIPFPILIPPAPEPHDVCGEGVCTGPAGLLCRQGPHGRGRRPRQRLSGD